MRITVTFSVITLSYYTTLNTVDIALSTYADFILTHSWMQQIHTSTMGAVNDTQKNLQYILSLLKYPEHHKLITGALNWPCCCSYRSDTVNIFSLLTLTPQAVCCSSVNWSQHCLVLGRSRLQLQYYRLQSFCTGDLLTGYAHESERVINAGQTVFDWVKRELTF